MTAAARIDDAAVERGPASRGRGSTVWRSRLANGVLWLLAGIALVYLFAPIFVIVLFSFNNPVGNFNIVWQEFTLENWAHPFAERELTDALWVSIQVAIVSTLIATVLGSLIAIALSRYRFLGSGVIGLFLILPLTAPEIVMGSSLSTLFFNRGAVFGFWTVVIAHVMFQVAFVALTVRARIRGFDWTLEQAAMDLGASPFRTFWKITFPLILPGILAAALLAFALSIDDFIITFFNAGSLITFPLQIYGASRVRIPPQIHVLATLILLVSVALMATGAAFGARRERRMSAER
jgi:spermidine/putrescine transport system permease protein